MNLYWIGIIVFLIGFGIRIVSKLKYARLRMSDATARDSLQGYKYKKRLYIGNVIAIIGLVINLIGLASADIYILI